MKKFVMGFVIGGMLFSGVTAFAANGLIGSKVQSLMTVEKDGEKIADAVVINGSSYAPVRAISEATGTKLTVQGKKIILGDATSTSTAKNSRTIPAKLGESVAFKDYSGRFSGYVSVKEVIRGSEVLETLKEANQFNADPQDGYEYMMAKINVKVTKVEKEGTSVRIHDGLATLVSTTGTAYDYVFTSGIEPSFNTDVYAGSSHEGWVVFQVKTTDKSPVIVFCKSYDGSGGAWFKTS